MRRLLPFLFTLILLSGCGGEQALPTAAPAPGTPTPVATPTPEVKLAWWAELGIDNLPKTDEEVRLSDGTSVRCLGQLFDPDVGLYSVLYAERNTSDLYLRYEDRFERHGIVPFFTGVPETELFWDDFDGDGAEELLFTLRVEQRSFLAVARWDDGWTYLPYDSYSADLEAVLTYDYRSRTATVTYGRDSATYTAGVQEAGRIGLNTDFSGYSFFNLSGNTISAVFGVGVNVNGEVRYFAAVNADVDFDGEGYTLRSINLIPFGGV